MSGFVSGYLEVLKSGDWQFAGTMIANELYVPEEPNEEPPLVPSPFVEAHHSALGRFLLGNSACLGRRNDPLLALAARGIPSDASPELAGFCAHAVGESNVNWLLGTELLQLPWARPITRRAMVHPDAAHLFATRPDGFPTEGWPAHLPISYSEDSRDGVVVEWVSTLARTFANLHNALDAVRDAGPGDRVRALFTVDH